MISPRTQIEQALTDVRRAYRLLHEYQRTALDAAKYISTQLGFRYGGGSPNFSACSPGEERGSLDLWAWDWLNLYYYDFCFYRDSDDLRFSIFLFSDTGYFISDDTAAEKTAISTFAPAETSSTKIGFLLYRKWAKEFGELLEQREVLRNFIEKDGELPPLLKKGGVVGKCCDFSRLCDEVSSDQVINEIVDLARRNRLPLERIKKAV